MATNVVLLQLVELSELFYEHVKGEGFHLADVRISQANDEHGRLMEEIKWRTYCLAAVGKPAGSTPELDIHTIKQMT